MSLGGGNSRALDEGINALTDVRIHIAVAAGATFQFRYFLL
jgi:hypothetical protein